MVIRNKALLIRKAAPFQSASPETLKKLSALAEPRRVDRETPLWAAGEHGAGPVLIRSGIVREAAPFDERGVTLGLHGRGDFVGVESALGLPSGGGADAWEDCVLLQFRADDLAALIASDGGLASGIAKLEAARRLDLQARLGWVTQRSASQRVAAVFLDLARRFGVRDSRGTILNVRLTHREIASLIGATRETVSFVVSDLQRSGVLEREGRIFVLMQRQALARIAAGTP